MHQKKPKNNNPPAPQQKQEVNREQKKNGRYEIFNSNNGKPSACKWIGSISALVSLMMIVVIIIFYMAHVAEGALLIQIIDKLIEVFGISAGLLGIKSISSSIGGNKVTIQNTTNSDGSMTRTKTMSRRYGGAGGGYEDEEETQDEMIPGEETTEEEKL